MQWIAMLLFPGLIILGFVFTPMVNEYMAEYEEEPRSRLGIVQWILGLSQLVLSVLSFVFASMGVQQVLESMGAYRCNFMAIEISTFFLYVFGLTCWNLGRLRGKEESNSSKR